MLEPLGTDLKQNSRSQHLNQTICSCIEECKLLLKIASMLTEKYTTQYHL